MRATPIAVLMSLMCACSAGDLTTSSDPLTLIVPQTSVAPGAIITASVTNRTGQPFTTYVALPCGGPFERSVAGDWVRLGNPNTLCAGGAFEETLAPNASLKYSWLAPADTGTYRAVIFIGSLTLISHSIMVR